MSSLDLLPALEYTAVILAAIGVYILLIALLRFPPHRVVKNLTYLARQYLSGGTINSFLSGISDKIAKYVHLNESKRDELKNELDTLEMHMSPEQFIASCLTKGLILLPLLIPATILFAPLDILVIALCVLVSYREYKRLENVFKQEKKEIDAELPNFVSVTEQTFQHDRNVLHLLETYTMTDETPLTKQLKVVIADMQTGSSERALAKFSRLYNSVYLSDTVRGLLATLHGEDTTEYFKSLSRRLSDEQDAIVTDRIMRLPSKIKPLAILHLASIMLIYAYIFITVGLQGLSQIFGF